MPVYFEKTVFGDVYINSTRYSDVLVVGDKIKPRQTKRLDQQYGGHHLVGDFEVEELLANQPEVIIIGNGQSGVLKVSDRIRVRVETAGAEFIVLETPEAIEKYNQLTGKGKKVNCLVHTTC